MSSAAASDREVARDARGLGIRERVAALPTWMLLGGVVATAFLVRLVLALRDPAPWIFHDEAAYAELAKSLAFDGSFAIRDVPGTGGFGVGYPILIAPAFALFDSVPAAYDAVRVLNCLMASLAAVPVYFIARRVASRGLAIAAAALSLAIPTLMYTGNVMTENAFYPLVMAFALAAIRVFERPTVWRQALVFALLGVAFVIRAQAIVLVPVLGTALAIVVVLDVLAASGPAMGRIRRTLTPYWPSFALVAAGVVAIPVRQAMRGEPLVDLLGAYGGITALGYDAGAFGEYLVYHLADLDLLVGVVPFAAFIAFTLWTLRPSQPRELRIFSATGLSFAVWFVSVAAAYGSTGVALRIVERNMFHVAPFLFIALAGWIAHACPRPWWAVAPAALFAGTLTLGLPITTFLNATVVHSTPALMPVWRWSETTFSARSIDEVVFAAAALSAAAFVVIPRRLAPLLVLVVLAYLALATRPVEALTHAASVGARFGVGLGPPDWVDREVDEPVATFWWAGSTAVPFWETEFFNRRIGRAYSLTGPYDGLTHAFTYLSARPSGLMVDGNGAPVRERYVMTDGGTHLAGTVVIRNPVGDLAVYRLDPGPMRVEERIDGLYPDRWSGGSLGYKRFGCRPGRLQVAFDSNPLVHPQPFEVIVRSGGREVRRLRVDPAERRTSIALPLQVEEGACSLEFEIPTGAATSVDAGDLRQLGLHFLQLRYEPSR